jgi:hypothetical protein
MFIKRNIYFSDNTNRYVCIMDELRVRGEAGTELFVFLSNSYA